MRRLLLWASQNRLMRRMIPRLWFARRAVRRFMPGEDLDAALDAAQEFQAQGIGSLFTHLGENLTSLDEAQQVSDHYAGALKLIKARGLDTEISVKLTQLGLDLDPEVAMRHSRRLARAAERAGSFFWIDMEGSPYTEVTVALYERLRRKHPNTGICLQAYLRRTADDIQRLLPLEPAIRLVKGAYDEPGDVAFTSKREVDAHFLAQAITIALASRQHPVRLALGTHDVRLVEEVVRYAAAGGVERSAVEVHMLYGIRVDQQLRLAREGYVVRDLIAYGEHWYPWYVRRLAERPANVLFVARQFLPRLSRK